MHCLHWVGLVELVVLAITPLAETVGMVETLQLLERPRPLVALEALESEDEMREACRRIGKPMMANMADGGKTPIRSGRELADIGYKLAIYPSATGLAAAKAVENA